MIRYTVTLDNLKEQIVALAPTWFERTAAFLETLSDEPASGDFNGYWSEIKDVYVALQHSKCAFCEKPLEGRIEQDVEHFRPKAAVSRWEPPQDLIAAGITVKQPANGSDELGYRFLAYHPLNYATSCKNCNSIFKGNLFPIVRTRKSDAKKPPAVTTENNYLIYPIGTIDEDPEQLINFLGCVPQPVHTTGHDRFRAMATISIFKLDDPVERRVFYEGRSKAIQLLFLNLNAIDNDPNSNVVDAAKKNVASMMKDSEPYANCLRCFHALYKASPTQAAQIFSDITVFLDSISPS